MTAIAGIGYLLLAFSPAFAIFNKFIVTDPLRIILFAFGAFFWLLSLLFSSLFWFILLPFREWLSVFVLFSIITQELSRVALFILIKRAQKGLSFMAASDHHKRGVHTLYNARHMLAIVCGIGMGTMAAYFAIINVVADFWGEGTVGLPATVPGIRERFKIKLYAKDQYFPITYAISACFLTLCHVFWTIVLWDACHKKGEDSYWWRNVLFVSFSHLAFSGSSFFNQDGYPVLVLLLQFCVVLLCAVYSVYVIAKNMTVKEVISRFLQAAIAWVCCHEVEGLNPSWIQISEAARDENAEPQVVNT